MSTVVFDVLKTAIERRRCVKVIVANQSRDVCPLALGYKANQLKVLAFQYKGASTSGLNAHGGWRCFSLAEISWAKINDDPWQSGPNIAAKREASLDTVICGAGTSVRTYGPPKRT
jgi:uncharacterized protein